MGENNFHVCEEVQKMQVFVAEGRRVGGRGKKRKSELTSWGMNAYDSDLMTAWHINTKLNAQL